MKNLYITCAFYARTFELATLNPYYFSTLSKQIRDSIVVMDKILWECYEAAHKNTYETNNVHVVVYEDLQAIPNSTNAIFIHKNHLDTFIDAQIKNVYIIGGATLFERYMGKAAKVYATIIDSSSHTSLANTNNNAPRFPINNFNRYVIEDAFDETPISSVGDNVTVLRRVTYKFSPRSPHGEYSYLALITNILSQNTTRPDRTHVGTYSVFGPQLRFDISTCIPLLTTKFVTYKTILKELLFFLKGETDSHKLEAEKVTIWKGNTSREFLDKRGLSHYREGLMGPMYGCNWRHFGGRYNAQTGTSHGGFDQLHHLLQGLREDPYSRRHMITTFDPSTVSQCVLAPCHGIVTQFYVDEGVTPTHEKTLSCHVYCRSSDIFLGLPFNIASYAILTYIIAAKCDMTPKDLIITMGDAHIYTNHIQQVQEQLARPPLPFPILEVSEQVKDKPFEELNIDDFALKGYLHHPSIHAPMAV